MTQEFTDDEIEEFEAQLEDTDLKALLIDVASTNRAILEQLVFLNQQLSGQSESESEIYRCTMCGEKVIEENLESHARDDHNAPPGSDINSLGMYEPV